ncbi:MAG TPA: acetylxylan esterase [Symbiobacteriaceae bacterium]|nr:acetylxylan esterase [Symbiobacteriaceae bacterium]
MPTLDWPLERLTEYLPPLTREADFDQFWADALAELAAVPVTGTLNRLDYPCDNVAVYRLEYPTCGGQTVTAWYLLPVPALRRGVRIPAIAAFHGYGHSKGRVTDHLHWVLQGYAVLAMDTRGQAGDTADCSLPVGGQMTGRMTQGIHNPATYYYRGVFQDALRAVQWLRTRPEIDPARVVATGNSQGGGLTLAVAALDPQLAAAMPDVPYLCNFRRAVDVHTAGPYNELLEYMKRRPEHVSTVFRTLSYFDNMNLAERIACPVLCSVALIDTICPPSTVFAAYNRITAPKEIRIYPYNGHEGGGSYHVEEKYGFLRRLNLGS